MPVPIRFVIVVSGWGAAWDQRRRLRVRVKNKKAAVQAFAPVYRGSRVDLSGSFACGRPSLDACSVAREGLVYFKAGTVPVFPSAGISNEISWIADSWFGRAGNG
ncbi:hypothetical protein LB543_29530 [Mesorhizobium sp. ESP7-2]|nr:hypothetical protein [Mesorhizobium sp. ESP7-2]